LTLIPTDGPSLFTPFEDDSYFVAWRDQARVAEQLRSYAAGDDDGFFGVLRYIDDFAAVLGVSPFAPPPTPHQIAAKLPTPELEGAFGKFFLGSIRDLAAEWLASEQARALIAIRGVVAIQAGPSMPGTPVPLLIRPLSLAARKPTSAN